MDVRSNSPALTPQLSTVVFNAAIPYVTGCAAGMIATVSVQPIDTLKVRMQLMEQGRGGWQAAKSIVLRDGVHSLYKGLSAGLLRQLIYGTARLGLFSTFEEALKRQAEEQGKPFGFAQRATAGLGAGALAAMIGNPTEVALIRMQADAMKPLEQRQNFKSAFDAIGRLVRKEGVRSLWNGSAPNIVRAMSTNFGQLAFFSESKHQIKQHTNLSPRTQTGVAALLAGFIGSVISLPFDFIKTRLQNQSMVSTTQGFPVYTGTADCFIKVIRKEGLGRFYRDFWPYFMKVGPHS